MKKHILIITLLLSACMAAQPAAPDGPSVETVVAATLQSMTAAAPPPTLQTGTIVTVDNISFIVPPEWTPSQPRPTSIDVEYPYINPSGGPMPSHAVFQFTNYPVEGEARIMVFKAAEYAEYGEPLLDTVTALLAGEDASQPFPEILINSFSAQAKSLPFQTGHGLRHLTQVLTGYGPITNRDLFYYYQGITNDGVYFVSAVFHVNASFLVPGGSKDSPTPPDGIPFDWSPGLDIEKYLGDVSQKLNDTPAENFTPSLTVLDNIIESMQVTSP